MTVDEAVEKATELNKTGKHCNNWFYYPARHDSSEWFVMRRPKKTSMRVAMSITGKLCQAEQ